MRTFLALTLALTLAGFTGPAWAGVNGSAHDVISSMATTNFGACSACHIPHKAFGSRLWPATIAGTDPLRGDVGNLCSYCHDSSISTLAAAFQDQVFKDQAGQTHGLTKANVPEAGSIDTSLPYGPGTTGVQALLQCTSCHNVHDQSLAGRNAFLQDDIDVLCSRCHPSRQWVGTAYTTTQGAWGARVGYDPLGVAGNPGSHPVGTDVLGDVSQHDIDGDTTADADSPVITSIAALLIQPYGPQGDYILGSHLIDGAAPANGTTFTGGVGCVTCHAVHGKDSGAGAADELMPNPDVLAVNQSEMSGAANGNLDTNNALCEACHQGTANTMVSAYFPNPGATTSSHPVDDAGYGSDAGVTKATIVALGWPTGDVGFNGDDASIICESCHMPHPLAAMSNAQDDPEAATNSHILRNTDNAICTNCHSGSVANHHPVNVAMSADATGLFFDADIGDQDLVLECADCHNGQGAHNWSGPGQVGLDPDWEPWDNARNTTDDAVGRAVADMSKECIDCHTPNQTRFSPTLPNVAGEYQDRGDASHFLGVPTTSLAVWPAVMTNIIAIPGGGAFTTDTWAGGGWSRFGGATGALAATSEMVCESCHDLEPDKNVGNNALLLYHYVEDFDEARSILCEGCHGPSGATGQAHPQTGDTVGRATLAARTPDTLVTATATSYAELGARGDTYYPTTANRMNCNTCHQPHDAVTAGGTYILESVTGANASLTEISGTPDTGVVVGGRTWANQRYITHATPLDYQNFCNICHASGQ